MKLTIVGMSGTFPGPKSGCSSYLIEHEGFRLLLDVGNGSTGALQEACGLLGPDAVVVSHLHGDHYLDLITYTYARRYHPDGQAPMLPVYGPSNIRDAILGAYGRDVGDLLKEVYDFHPVEGDSKVSIGPFEVDLRQVNHPVETYGMRISAGGRTLAYSADTGECGTLVDLAKDVDLFLCEASYLDGEDNPPDVHLTGKLAAQYATKAAAQKLLLTHLVPWGDQSRTLAEATANYDADILVARSLDTHEVWSQQSRRFRPHHSPYLGDISWHPHAPDGRADDALRPVTITRNWLDHAEGSVLVEFGKTRVLCAASVTEGVPRWRKGSGLGWVTAEYAMLPRATHTRSDRESVKGRIGGRTHEISRLVGRSLRAAIDYKALGENTIAIDCDVLQADGGTRTAAITGAYVALADAISWLGARGALKGEALSGSVAAISVGIIDGVPRLDLCYDEDVKAETDMNVVCMGDGRFVEVQGTAEGEPFDRAELNALLDLATAGCATLTRLQQQSLSS